jgi:hypothetical protein
VAAKVLVVVAEEAEIKVALLGLADIAFAPNVEKKYLIDKVKNALQ